MLFAEKCYTCPCRVLIEYELYDMLRGFKTRCPDVNYCLACGAEFGKLRYNNLIQSSPAEVFPGKKCINK